MSENCRYPYQEEIDPIDQIFYLMKHWRSLILAILIGVLIGGAMYAVKKTSADREAAATEMKLAETESEVETGGQTVAELKAQYQISEDVERNMELAYQYRQLYRKQLEYNQNSPIMLMNPSAVYTGELEYYVSAGYDTSMAALLYQNILSESGILGELKNAADLPYKEQYIRELVGCTVSRENDSSVNVYSDVRDVYRTAVVTFTVRASSEEECMQMMQLIRDKVEEVDQQCAENYDDYSMTPVNDSINLTTDSDYLSRQKSNTDQLNTYRNTMTNLESNFTEEELAYYNRVYLSREYEMEEEENSETETDVAVGTETTEPEPVSLPKWLTIGVLLMCVVWGVYYLVRYLLDKKIKMPDEIRSRYGLPLIGLIRTETDVRKGLDRWIERMRKSRWGSGDTEENVGAMISAMNLPRLLLCMEGVGEKLDITAKEVCVHAGCLTLSGSLYQNGDLVANAKESDGIILIVEIGGTDYITVERELEICRMQDVTVKGVVAIG